MAGKKHGAEQIIGKLREAEVLLSQGKTPPVACREAGISQQSYYRWRKEYGGLELDQAKRMKELERENVRLKRLVADLRTLKLAQLDNLEGMSWGPPLGAGLRSLVLMSDDNFSPRQVTQFLAFEYEEDTP